MIYFKILFVNNLRLLPKVLFFIKNDVADEYYIIMYIIVVSSIV